MTFDLAAQIANDLDDFDGLITNAEYWIRRTKSAADYSEPYRPLTIHIAELTVEEMLIASESAAPMRAWNVKKNQLDDHGIEPRVGDEIRECTTDADGAVTKWRIEEIKLPTLRTRYRFLCKKGES